MPSPTLQQFFGASATLVGGNLTLDLDDFADVGLSNTATAPGDILAAIILKIIANTPTDAATTDKLWSVTIGDPFISVVRDNEQLERSFPVSFYTPFTASVFDPDAVI
ncbi:MAG: hypothetical protein DCF32_06235 [Leptolyngbya sp.]|nr:MAG: hypothetical protein DCF32_06235 [Leptolyngbya sp.]